MMKNILAVLIFGSAIAALTTLAKSILVLRFLNAVLSLAVTVLPFIGGVAFKLVV
jgi:hypothetical protein